MILNTCFSHLGTILDHLGTTWSAILGPSWTILGPFQASWRYLGTILARRGDILSRLGPIWMNFPRRSISKHCVCARARISVARARLRKQQHQEEHFAQNTACAHVRGCLRCACVCANCSKRLRVRTCAGEGGTFIKRNTLLKTLRVRTCAAGVVHGVPLWQGVGSAL